MIAALERAGLVVERQSGSHVTMIRPGMNRPVVVPLHTELTPGVVGANLRTANISRNQYLQLLGKKSRRRKKSKGKRKK